jgi:hypothetical protein
VMILVTFFAWSRETRPSGGMGWLETARRANLADRFAEGAAGAGSTETVAAAPARTQPAARLGSVDDDEEQLAAYNAYLARINGPARRDPEDP